MGKLNDLELTAAQFALAARRWFDNNVPNSANAAKFTNLGNFVKALADNTPPLCLSAPTVSGVSKVGSILTASNGQYTHPPIGFSIRWFRGTDPIDNEANSTYIPNIDDFGQIIRYGETPADADNGEGIEYLSDPVLIDQMLFLNQLTITEATFIVNRTIEIGILNATTRSVVESDDLPLGLWIDSDRRVIGGSISDFGTYTFTLREKNSGVVRETIITIIVLDEKSLKPLTLSNYNIDENSPAGVEIGEILGSTAGSSISMVNDAGGRFILNGRKIYTAGVPTNYEAATFHEITVREALVGYINTPNDTVLTIRVNNLFEEPTLLNLEFSVADLVAGKAASGTILKTAPNSVLSATGLPNGMKIDSATRTWTYDGTGIVGTYQILITEALPDSANTPHTTQITLMVSLPAVIPSNFFFLNYGNDYASAANNTSKNDSGLNNMRKIHGLQAWLPVMSNHRLQDGRWSCFGENRTTSTQWLTNPRVNASGTVTTGYPWRPSSGSSNKSLQDAINHPAQIVHLDFPVYDAANPNALNNIKSVITTLRTAGKVIVMPNGAPYGISADGTDVTSGVPNDAAFTALTNQINKLHCRSGQPESIPGVYVYDAYNAFINPTSKASGGYRNIAGLTVNGYNDSVSGAKLRAKLIVDMLKFLWDWDSIPQKVTMPTSTGLVTPGLQKPFVNINPTMTPGTSNGSLNGGFGNSPDPAQICQGWELLSLNNSLNGIVTRGLTNSRGDFYQKLRITGSLAAGVMTSVYFQTRYPTTAAINQAFTAVGVSLQDKLRAMGWLNVDVGARGFGGSSLSLQASAATGPTTPGRASQNVTIFDFPISTVYAPWVEAGGVDLNGSWFCVQTDYMDLNETLFLPDNGGDGTATSYNSLILRWNIVVGSNFSTAQQTIDFTINFGPAGYYISQG